MTTKNPTPDFDCLAHKDLQRCIDRIDPPRQRVEATEEEDFLALAAMLTEVAEKNKALKGHEKRF